MFDSYQDPVYDSNGMMLLISLKMFFSLALDPFDERKMLELFLSTYKCVANQQEMLNLLQEEHERYKELIKLDEILNERERTRHEHFEQIIIKFIDLEKILEQNAQDENVLYLYEEGSYMGIPLSNFIKLYNIKYNCIVLLKLLMRY